MRIMFDTNAFDKMHDDLDKILACQKYEYYITSLQVEEIKNIPDNKETMKLKNFIALSKIQPPSLPVPAVVGVAKAGDCVPMNDSAYMDLLKVTHSNVADAMIGATAKRESCTVVTEDKDFSKRLRKHGIPTLTWDEFMSTL